MGDVQCVHWCRAPPVFPMTVHRLVGQRVQG